MYEDLKNKVVLVTGSSGAIGEEIVKYFASLGCKVVVTGRNEENIQRVRQECDTLSPLKYKALGVICDLAIESDVENLVKQTIDTFGQLDVLVNNAAYDKLGNILDENTLTEFDKQMNVNVRAVIHLCRLALPHLISSKGVIVNISAISKPMPFYFNMCLTNAALDMMTKLLALEFGPQGVRVNAVNPSAVSTKTFEKLKNAEQLRTMFSEKSALKRMPETREVVNTVAFLCSNVSSFITGALIPIDGGTSLT